MHMLRDEDNAGYRRVMRDTLEFDPGILGRFVNFLTNPDERPAAEQFGTGDKAFSAATLLATLPGLPMLGHGQVEGFRERYGMEFRKARWAEPVDEGHSGHFAWAIVPLLRRRAEFSGTELFHLYDAHDDGGNAVEDVYAYSNGLGRERNLVLVHHRHAETTVRIDHSVAAAPPGGQGGRTLTSVRLAEGLGLTGPDAPPDEALIQLRDARSDWELVRTAGELRREGLRVSLGAYEARVLSVGFVRPEAPEAPAKAALEKAATAAAGPIRRPTPLRRSARRPPQPPRRRSARRPRGAGGR
jgi:hypothetical protein